MPISFSKLKNHYLSNQNIIPISKVQETETTITKSTDYRIDLLTDKLIKSEIDLATWEKSLAQELKTLHVKRTLLSRGGKKASTTDDWLIVGRILRQEYKFLHEMARDIRDGKLSEPELKARTKLYTQRARLSGEAMKQNNAKDVGLVYMERKLGATDRHCAECLSYASMGLRLIGELPLPTERCTCMANCKCSVRYYGSRVAREKFLV